MFGSKTVLTHILRGVIGFGALALAILFARDTDTASVLGSVTLAIVALIALRGCPICWAMGMAETLRGNASHMFKTRP
jgi:hypothetical protein